ncbi:MAG: hypothetical protein KKH68_12765 [Proteobacteria bacterium]|nr:hypothetical protein [Pseudomonadota bacterium]
MNIILRIGIFLCCISLTQINTATAIASASKPWHNNRFEWGGQIKFAGAISWPEDESFLQADGRNDFYDGSAEFRLKNKLFLAPWGYFETHYEAIASGGDTRQQAEAFQRRFPGLCNDAIALKNSLNDNRRLLDLTKTIHENDELILYHRLDRFALTLQPAWGTVRIGRQALTWGNGLLFNPMDLFNPFSPTDIVRDYKIGDDMATIQFPLNSWGDFQLLCVPRRNPANNHLEYEQSSVAGKLHLAAGTTEFDFMASRHYKDTVFGLGSIGYFKDAAWRLDTTYTFLNDPKKRDGFFCLTANIDTSWVWQKKNYYGLLEFYYNGLGGKTYSETITDPDIAERLARGEIFTLGRTFIGSTIQIELHPLLNLYLTAINNLQDPSGIIQPRFIWDVLENVRLTCGANLYYGRVGTEFGGFILPSTGLLNQPSDNTFVWLTCFF